MSVAPHTQMPQACAGSSYCYIPDVRDTGLCKSEIKGLLYKRQLLSHLRPGNSHRLDNEKTCAEHPRLESFKMWGQVIPPTTLVHLANHSSKFAVLTDGTTPRSSTAHISK